ncbi:MAG: D-alanine--D-alanine ligase [Desulfohalobiaceae bacterium]|nr:D-alanine--D-alanine ligase [Desulfohalobiaceae bacterium]
MRILLIGGGWSNEREVSLKGVSAIHSALEELGHEVELFDPATSFSTLPERAGANDFAFINLHGAPGEDGVVQAVLEQAGCPYQGSGPKGSLLALDKSAAKTLFAARGIPTPDWEFVPMPPAPDWRCRLDPPVFLKPHAGGSSLDVVRATGQEEIRAGVDRLLAQGDYVLIEESISGEEVTCPVLGEKALPPILIRPADASGFFDYFSKYTPQAAEEICPAPIPEELTREITDLALLCHRELGLSDYSRTDFLVRDGRPFALETNTLPGMTANSLFPKAAAAVGYSFTDLIAELIRLGLSRHGSHET